MIAAHEQDRRLIRGATRRLALQAAAVVAASVLCLTALAGLLAIRNEHNAADTTLRQAAAQADDVGDPPPNTWLALTSPAGQSAVTPGMPVGFPLAADLAAVDRSGRVLVRDVHRPGHEYRVRTDRRPNGSVAQAILDLRPAHSQQAALIAALLSAGGMGLLVAGAVGASLARRAVRPLAEALARQRDFVADASHELRTPVTLLSTRVQLLQRAVPPAADPELATRLAGVAADTARIVQLVDDLLLTAERDATTGHQPVDLTQLAKEIVESAADHAAQKQVRLTAPTASGSVLVSGNHVALRRAVLAVLDNAIEHTPVAGQVTIHTSQDGAQGALTVQDTGPGLRAGEVDRIFDRFHSGRQKAGRRSYGLGLSLARDIAETLGGTLTVSSTGPDGSTFSLRVPMLGQRAQGLNREGHAAPSALVRTLTARARRGRRG
jgi:signal transduction histidine kinase